MNKNKCLLLAVIVLFSACKTTINKDKCKDEETSLKMENCGVAGNTTINLIGRLEKDVLNKKPDLVIFDGWY